MKHRNPYLSIHLVLLLALFFSIFCTIEAFGQTVISDDAQVNTDTSGTAVSIQRRITSANVTLTVNALLERTSGASTVRVQSNGVTVTNNAGASIVHSSGLNRAVRVDANQTNFTLNNSGTISSNGDRGVDMRGGSTVTINNNSGGTITAPDDTLRFISSGGTINNSGTLSATNGRAINSDGTSTGLSVNNNIGGVITAVSSSSTVRLDDGDTLINNGSITNTGTGFGIDFNGGSTSTIDNNSGATITATNGTVNFSSSGGTINNSGTLSATNGLAINSDGTSTGLSVNNNIGGVITAVSSSSTVILDVSDTLINNGSITNTGTGFSIDFNDNNSTVTLKEGSILVGTIDISDGTTGNTIQVEQGYGQTYFYDTTGTGAYTVQDLSGNAIVKGSAGSVGQGAQESMDELLGLRTYNLRSALKRYSAFPKHLIEDELYIEPFSYYSKRGSNSSILSYENYGYGLNFIYPIKSKKFDLILTVEKSELEIQRDHDVSNTNFLAGINATDLISVGPWKASGFLVAGMGWHNGKRRIFTNTTASGLLDVRSDYKNYEVMTGSHANYSFSSGINTWDTEVGLTFGYSLTPDYREHAFFRWGERHLVQGSIHVGEQLTSKVNSKLNVIVGAELEHRTVLTGREQSYSINKTLAKSRNGQFWQNSVAGKLGANYSFNNNMFTYLNIDSRFSNLIRGTYGASVGLKLNF